MCCFFRECLESSLAALNRFCLCTGGLLDCLYTLILSLQRSVSPTLTGIEPSKVMYCWTQCGFPPCNDQIRVWLCSKKALDGTNWGVVHSLLSRGTHCLKNPCCLGSIGKWHSYCAHALNTLCILRSLSLPMHPRMNRVFVMKRSIQHLILRSPQLLFQNFCVSTRCSLVCSNHGKIYISHGRSL